MLKAWRSRVAAADCLEDRLGGIFRKVRVCACARVREPTQICFVSLLWALDLHTRKQQASSPVSIWVCGCDSQCGGGYKTALQCAGHRAYVCVAQAVPYVRPARPAAPQMMGEHMRMAFEGWRAVLAEKKNQGTKVNKAMFYWAGGALRQAFDKLKCVPGHPG